MARLDSFLRMVADQGASDLHFDAGTVPLIRHDGDLTPLPFRKLSEGETMRFVRELLTKEEREALENRHELDFVYALEGVGRFRCNVFNHSRGVGAVFRIIPKELPTLDGLDLPFGIRKLLNHQNGLVLVCGPTGSGKTSTLAAMVNEINRDPHRNKHIITVEDPVEFIHEPVHSVITQRQVGLHCETFSAALRSALREAPDVIVVGELRDLETMSLALSAAETGALVLGTLHTNSAAKAVDRIVDAFPEEQREQMRGVVAVLLRGIVAQHLVKKSNGEGRVAVVEVLIQNFALAHMIREGKIHQIQAYLASPEHRGSGMQGLDSCLFNYVRQGVIATEDALHLANDPDTLRRQISELPEEM
jgi:twitching motility protein PilT